jgi:hypothetical protein
LFVQTKPIPDRSLRQFYFRCDDPLHWVTKTGDVGNDTR